MGNAFGYNTSQLYLYHNQKLPAHAWTHLLMAKLACRRQRVRCRIVRLDSESL